MNIFIVHGTERKGSTYHVAHEVIKHLPAPQVQEVFLPKDFPSFCISCNLCFQKNPSDCPHAQHTLPLREKLLWADLIVLTSPVYAMHLTGQMKAFLDHFANMFVIHRPEEVMFAKRGLVVSTGAGPVCKATLKEMKDSLDFWGVAKTGRLGFGVYAINWSEVSEKKKRAIAKKAQAMARKLQGGRPRVCFRVKKWFYISRALQKRMHFEPDYSYWQEKGWLGKKRPWRTK